MPDVATSPESPKHALLRGLESQVYRRRKRGKCLQSIESRAGILPEVLADLTGPLGDRVRKGLPGSSMFTLLEGSRPEIRDVWGVTNERWQASSRNLA